MMFEIDRAKFGSFVAELRKEKGYTQKELASQLFISDKAVSKWETGASIPDTSLLIPLAELLGVSVTELLLSKRQEAAPLLDTAEVETVVKTAILYSEENAERAYITKSRWGILYILSAVLGFLTLFLGYLHGYLSEMSITGFCMGAAFGAYFVFFIRTKLPRYYDENRINTYTDGFFQLSIPGISLNNANWRSIIVSGRIWSVLAMVLFPALSLLLHQFCPAWVWIERAFFLVLMLGGLFIPMYVIGKR